MVLVLSEIEASFLRLSRDISGKIFWSPEPYQSYRQVRGRKKKRKESTHMTYKIISNVGQEHSSVIEEFVGFIEINLCLRRERIPIPVTFMVQCHDKIEYVVRFWRYLPENHSGATPRRSDITCIFH